MAFNRLIAKGQLPQQPPGTLWIPDVPVFDVRIGAFVERTPEEMLTGSVLLSAVQRPHRRATEFVRPYELFTTAESPRLLVDAHALSYVLKVTGAPPAGQDIPASVAAVLFGGNSDGTVTV